MDKLERGLARFWRRMSGGKQREKRQKKIDGSKNNSTSRELTSDIKSQCDTQSSPTHHLFQNQSSQNSRTISPSQDLSLALTRLYVYARLKSLHNSIVAESSPLSDEATNLDNTEPMRSMDLFVSSLPQISSHLRSQEFQKLCRSRESGYLTNSPCDFSSSSETLKQQVSPSLYVNRELSNKSRFTPKEKIHSSYGDIWCSSVLPYHQYYEYMQSYLSRHVYKSKCVTCVFEAAHAGLAVLIDDVLAEFKRWFVGKKMLVVASELHFSVPFSKRCRKQEQILKQQLLRSLHENNRRILYLRGTTDALSEDLACSRTEENIYNDNRLQTVQGVYQRCYHRLLPLVHAETPNWHAPYWKLLEPPIRPCSSAFLLADDDSEKLRTHSFVSFNIIGLSFYKIKHKSCDVLV